MARLNQTKLRREEEEAFLALHSSIGAALSVFCLYFFVTNTIMEPRLQLSQNPNLYQQQVERINRLVRGNDIDCQEQLRVNRLVRGNDIDCQEQLRVNRHTFLRLCCLVRGVGLGDSQNVCLEERVAIFLWILSHHTKHKRTKFEFWRSSETVGMHFNAVLLAVLRLHKMLLARLEPVPPDDHDNRWNWFQNCLGALDGTFVPVNPPAADRPRYMTRNGEIATNVLGVCNRDLQFVYILFGWEGSATDSRILGDAITRPHGLKVPHGQYYLVDGGYPNGEGFLSPYLGQRYHLNIWRQGHIPVSKEEYFNMKHSAARNVIERSFGVVKMRFAILRAASHYPIRTQGRIVTACCLLHNLIKREMPNDPVELEYTLWEQQNLHNVEVDNYIGQLETSNEWTKRRDALATAMYNHWLANGEGNVEEV